MTKRLSRLPVLTPLVAATETGRYLIAPTLEWSMTVSLCSSGFEGPWTFSPTTLTNDFYKLLFDEKWVWKKWNGPKQYEDKKTRSLMMLPCAISSFYPFCYISSVFSADYTLTTDKSFRKYAQAYAQDQGLFFKE
jgi:cytochrome c peroxidase